MKRNYFYLLSIFLVFLLSSINSYAQVPDFGNVSNFNVIFDQNNDQFKIILRSTLDNTQRDSWSNTSTNEVFIDVNGTNVWAGKYDKDGSANGFLTSTTVQTGVTTSVTTPSYQEIINIFVPVSYFEDGTNEVRLHGTWKERIEDEDDILSNVDVTKSIDYDKPLPPGAPEGVTAEIDQFAKVTLSWSAPSQGDSPDYYTIFQNGSHLATLDPNITNWTDPNPNTSQTPYRVNAVNDEGSNGTDITPPEPPSPSIPSGFSATQDNCDGVINLTWDYSGEVDPVGFVIYRDGSAYATINSGSARAYSDVCGEHQTHTYKIYTKGPLSGTIYANSGFSEVISGASYGEPSQPLNFNANATTSAINLSWNTSSNASKYLIKRISTSGNVDYEITNPNQNTFVDNQVNACETYRYQIFAANSCTQEQGIPGIEASNEPQARVEPYLGNYIQSVDASKAYFPDKITVSWSVLNNNISLVDEFQIERRKAGDPDFETIATVSNQATYDDISAIAGIVYEYRITGKVNCENDVLPSNSMQTIGFRLPYAVVNGHIQYENGQAVKGVQIIAEKSTEAIGTSLEFNGTNQVNVPSSSYLNPSEFIIAEAWIRPTSLTGIKNIINKQSSTNGYRLYQNDNNVVFEINVDGNVQTVTAQNVLTTNEYIHVAGVKDSTGVKIYINGKVPFDRTYVLDSTSIAYLADINISQDVIDSIANIQDIVYNSYNDFYNGLVSEIGQQQADGIMPLLIPLAQQDNYQPGTFINITGNIVNATNNLEIGAGFVGQIDEIRIWNIAKDDNTIYNDYKRIIAGDATGLQAYWRCDENFGNHIYDAAKSFGVFHKNDGLITNPVWSPVIPSSNLVSWMGISDENGDYTIPYIPYFGTGENATITPRFEQHQFDPSSRTIFIGDGANAINGQNFTDISSFEVNGRVTYEGTHCGVEGCLLSIDGQPVLIENQPVYTDAAGEYHISVPVGKHYISVSKQGHIYKSYKFPPGPETAKFDFQESITGLSFIDQTKVRVVGRVVGGTVESNKLPGLGLSKNNIGVAHFTFEQAGGCTSYDITTDSLTGEYVIDLPPMTYVVNNFTVPKNPQVAMYFTEFPSADFSVVEPAQQVEYTYNNVVNATISIDTVSLTATIDLDGLDSLINITDVMLINGGTKARFYYNTQAYEYNIDTTSTVTVIYDELPGPANTVTNYYNYTYDLIYRSVPEIQVTASDGESEFTGDKEITYEDPLTKVSKTLDIETHPFWYPVFTQNHIYQLKVFVQEVYYNQDVCSGINGCPEAVEDVVPVGEGSVQIHNQLAKTQSETIELHDGVALYTFMAGEPQTLRDYNYPWRTYTGVLNLTAMVDGVGYAWEPYQDTSDLNFDYPMANLLQEDKYFRAYVLGSNPIEGSDFVTDGPELVEMILRDPPGSESYSYLEQGSSFTINQSYSMNLGVNTTSESKLSLGSKWESGIGYSVETEIKNETTLGLSVATSINDEGFMEKTVSLSQAWQTSDSPELAGAASDLFYGSSTNYRVSLADNLRVFPADFAQANGLDTAGESVGEAGDRFIIGMNKSLMAAPEGTPTHFIYTADHIENYLIPNLIQIRNNLFISQADKYHSNIPSSNELYGSNNDDPRWGSSASSTNYITTEPADYDGPSYTFTPEDDQDVDMIRKYNEQIRLWREALERNEMEKYSAELIDNISFDAGPTYDYSIATSITKSHTTSFELAVNASLYNELGGSVGGIGGSVKVGLEIDLTSGRSSTTENTVNNTFGYVLHDPDQGDYFSVDVKDPGTGTGPVFSIKGGRSMCPHETGAQLHYYKPATYTINDSVINQLENLGVNQDLLDILSTTEAPDYNSIFSNYDWYNALDASVRQDILDYFAQVEVPQIKERVFKKQYLLKQSVYQMIDLGINITDENGIDTTGISQNIQSGNTSSFNDMLGGTGNSTFHLFTQEQRKSLKEEFVRYSSYIYDLSETLDPSPDQLNTPTIRREVPVASITPDIQTNIPDDNTAYFTLILGNNSYTNETMWYETRLLEESNPNGAIISIDGDGTNRTFEIAGGEQINKTISVKQGRPDVFDYDSLKLVFYSSCEWDYHTNGMTMPAEAIDTVVFSVHFVPSCSDIDISIPEDNYIVNTSNVKLVNGVNKTKIPVVLSGYDLTNTTMEKISFQFKSEADNEWITPSYFYVNPTDTTQEQIPGNFTGLEWDMSGYPDGVYQIRAKTYCGNSPDGTEIFDLSPVFTGTVDRESPQVFGSPQPADGILSPNDDISISFNEDINSAILDKDANFDIRGILNGSDLMHDVSAYFDNNTEDFIRIPDGINLSNKSFTIEFWLKPNRSNFNECIINQNTSSTNNIYIGLTQSGNFIFKVGDQSIETENINVPGLINQWHHFAFVYDNVVKEATVMLDGVPTDIGYLDGQYSGFGDIYLGKSISGNANPFKGNIHELRIWERPRTASKIASNMMISLSGKETGLIGYWPINEASGTLLIDKVHRRNADMRANWNITPSGYACSFDAGSNGLLNIDFADVAFTEEQNFTIEFWFKSANGINTCFMSNGHGDYDDVTLYYITQHSLAKIESVLPLEDSVNYYLSPVLNQIYSNPEDLLDAISLNFGLERTIKYKEQILRYATVTPTYWCINTDENGYIQVKNNGHAVKLEQNYFDNKWHHFALVVNRQGNTKILIDGDIKKSVPSTEWNGFGAAKLFIGARAFFDVNIQDFTFDQYFNGSIDEVRIWSSALKQTQIDRDRNMRLDGDELGLVSYFPFESYEEIMGVPQISGTYADVLSNRQVAFNTASILQNTVTPNIRMKRPSSKVDFDFTASNNKIYFTINEPVAKIENCILDITTKDVKDMFGNSMEAAEKWSAFVDVNEVKWSNEHFELEKLIYDTLSFSTYIVNNSGLQQNFSIENVPEWLSVSQETGTLAPMSSQQITFTVNPGVNIGRYSTDINLHTDYDFNEKLLVNLRVYNNLPADWNINPQNYVYSMNIIGKIIIDGAMSIDKYDKVAAFVGDECRGIGQLQYVPDYDMYEVFLDVYSNTEYGENFELHIWDASTGREYRKVIANGLPEAPAQYPNCYQYINNAIYGSPQNPVPLIVNNELIQKIPVYDGWNWMSFNIAMDETKPLSLILNGIEPEDGDIIKSINKFTQFYNNSWIGNLHQLNTKEMYMFNLNKSDTLIVSGTAVNPDTSVIHIVNGWNWIGYTPLVNIEINEAFGKFNASHGDVVKSQYDFSMYDEQMGWIGTLDYLRPNMGYKYYYTPDSSEAQTQDLIYPKQGSLNKNNITISNKEHFKDANKYPNNMPLIAVLKDSSINIQDYKLNAYIDNSLRGSTKAIFNKVNGKYMFFLTIYGETGDLIKYKLVSDNGQIYDIVEQSGFDNSKVKGSLESPVVLSLKQDDRLSENDSFGLSISPNPFNDRININFNSTPDSDIKVEIYNILGEKLKEFKYASLSDNKISIATENWNSGTYIIKIKLNNESFVRKLIKYNTDKN